MPNNATAFANPVNPQKPARSHSGRSQRPDEQFRSRELCEIAKHGLSPDATVVELGCGAGAMTRALAKLVPQGRAIGLDPDSATIQNVVKTLHPAIFPNKTMVKYFLSENQSWIQDLATVILEETEEKGFFPLPIPLPAPKLATLPPVPKLD